MEIPINRKHLLKMLTLYSMVVLLVAALVYYLYVYEERIYYVLTAAFILSVLFYPFIAFKFIQLLRMNKPGLIIDDTGITDNVNAAKFGTIPWSDVKSIRQTKEFNSNFIIVDLVLPEKYTAGKTGFQKFQLNGLMNKYGSPCVINASTLNYNVEELQNLIQQYLLKK